MGFYVRYPVFRQTHLFWWHILLTSYYILLLSCFAQEKCGWLVLLWQLHLRPESWKKELISFGFLVLAVDESDERTDLRVVVQFLKQFWHLFLLFVTYVEFLSTSSLCNSKDCEVTVLQVNWRVPDGFYHLTSADSNQSTQCMKVIMEVNMDTLGKKKQTNYQGLFTIYCCWFLPFRGHL